ncbi:hypothetical protein CPB84DRAFT_1750725 [Gymnopilus junonius]|uniref:Uncharacterized protein n=1 Tax=Gymnopilus junonius TaxID=109634 RepID=A0A9P5TJC1_GYMJU|nr:hypothetical protein CPB84DRAFT_1750725 [Gymnopilus junonius]
MAFFCASLISSFFLFGLTDAASITTGEWDSLNGTVGGRLKVGIPFAQPCFSLLGGGKPIVPNAAECSEVQSGYEDHCVVNVLPRKSIGLTYYTHIRMSFGLNAFS